MRALDDLVQQGKILYYGVSEWSPVQITKAMGIIKDMGLHPMTVLQARVQHGGSLRRGLESSASARRMVWVSCPSRRSLRVC